MGSFFEEAMEQAREMKCVSSSNVALFTLNKIYLGYQEPRHCDTILLSDNQDHEDFNQGMLRLDKGMYKAQYNYDDSLYHIYSGASHIASFKLIGRIKI